MKEFVIEMDKEIRQRITQERPELIEIKCKGILIETADRLWENKIIGYQKYLELHRQITKFYK